MRQGIVLGLLILLLNIGMAWGETAVPVSPGGDGAVIGQNCPTFSWSSAQGAISYKIEVYEQAATNMLPYDAIRSISKPALSSDIGAPALSWTPSGNCLKSGVSYVWYVGAVDSENTVLWSVGKAFEVDAAGLSPEQKGAVQEAVKEYFRNENAKTTITAQSSGEAQVSFSPALSQAAGITGSAGGSENETRQAQIVSVVTPVEIDKNSNVKATGFLYNAVKTRHVSFSGEMFQPLDSTYTWNKFSGQLTAATAYSWWNVPLHLPDGAVITKLSLTYWDNSSSYIQAAIYRLSFASMSQDSLAVISTTGASAAWQVASTASITNGTIDNSQYAYEVGVLGFDGTSNLSLGGIVVEYTVTTPLP